MISVVLGSYNRLVFLKLAIASVRNQINSPLNEIIVVDGGSTDGSLEWLLEQKDIITIVQHNRGEWLGKKIERRSWGYFMNLAFKCASSKYVCMISDDTVLHPGALAVGYAQFENLLAVGNKIGALAFYWRESFEEKLYRVGAPAGGLVYVNHGLFLRQALGDVDYIDEKAFKFYCADVDLCLKIWEKGYEIYPAQDAYLEHYPFATLSVKKGNSSVAQGDFTEIIKKWQQVYPQLNARNLGDMDKKEYEDPYKTISIYEPLHRTQLKNNKVYFIKKTISGYWNDFYGSAKFWYRKLKHIYFGIGALK